MLENFHYALTLEKSFNILLGYNYLSQDAFADRLTDAIQGGLGRLNVHHIIKDETFSEMCREYDFGDTRLEEIVKNKEYIEKLENLINFLVATWEYEKNSEQEDH